MSIWNQWSITDSVRTPIASAVRANDANVGPMASGPPGQVKPRHMDVELHVVLPISSGEGTPHGAQHDPGGWPEWRRYCRPGMSLVMSVIMPTELLLQITTVPDAYLQGTPRARPPALRERRPPGSGPITGHNAARLSPSLQTWRLHLRMLTTRTTRPRCIGSPVTPTSRSSGASGGPHRATTNSLKQLNPGVLRQLVVSSHGSPEVPGLVVAYNVDFRRRFCHAAVVMHPRLHRRGLGIKAFMVLARYVYYGWDFRMIIMEAVGIAFENFARGEEAGYFTVEGRIRDQFYYGGRYWDGISVTHRRDQFEKVL